MRAGGFGKKGRKLGRKLPARSLAFLNGTARRK